MENKQVEQIVLKVVKDYCDSNDITSDINVDTPLMGSERIVDSMGLVNMIVELETAFLDEGCEILLASESAMSRRRSPFLTVATLCEFINEQINGENNE